MLNLALKDLQRIEQLIIQLSENQLIPFLSHTQAQIKDDGSIVTEADLTMQKAIKNMLSQEFGAHIACLGEESNSQEQAKIVENENQYWVFDPLDGTTNFHASFPVFCISLALIQNQQVTLALTYDPIRKECFSALKNKGFFYNHNKLEHPPLAQKNIKESIAFIDFKRLTKQKGQQLIQDMPFNSQRNIGSSALEWAWLAMRRAHMSFHGGQKLWDYAAGSLLLSEAGGHSQDLEGKPLFQNTIQVRPVVAAVSHELNQQWFEAVQ